MLIKKKQFLLVAFSSSIITAVILSTFAGYFLYAQWREESYAAGYMESVRTLLADIYRKEIDVHGVELKDENYYFSDGSCLKGPMLEGKITNRTAKTITSVLLEVSLSGEDGFVLYREWFNLLKEKPFLSSPFFSSAAKEDLMLQPGECLSFRHSLKNCPDEALERYIKQTKGCAGKVSLAVSIVGVSVI